MNFSNWLESQPGAKKPQVTGDFGGLQIKNPIIRALMQPPAPLQANKEQEAVQRPDKPFIATETGSFGVDMGDK